MQRIPMLQIPTSQKKMNILASMKLAQALRIAAKRFEEGAIREANQIYLDVLEKFPRNKIALLGIKAARDAHTKNANDNRNPAPEQIRSIVSLYSRGKYHQVLAQIDQIIKLFPNSEIVHNILGVSNAALKQGSSAIKSYKRAIQIKPDYAEAYYNMGNALQVEGDLDAAIESFKQAIEIYPDYTGAYSNMGTALQDKGDLDGAIASYRQAIKVRPSCAISYNNMGTALNAKGNLEEAIESYQKAIEIQPAYVDAFYNLGMTLKDIEFQKHQPKTQDLILKILEKETYIRPKDIVPAVISLLKFDPSIRSVMDCYSIDKFDQSLYRSISSLCKVPLFLKLMSVCPISDLDFETILTAIRSKILHSLSEVNATPEILHFQSALALQCFTNEYIFSQTEKENKALALIESSVGDIISSGKKPNETAILCLASYKPLHEFEWSHSLAFPLQIKEVRKRQILEPLEEKSLRSQIPILCKITNNVSHEVRKQYEENPYPRWINLGLYLRPIPISKMIKELNLRLYDHKIITLENPQILIAGCGTGQHAIRTSSRFESSSVLALDLSLSSVAYAKRKTKELGIRNIEYIQGDILDLGKFNRRFDIVESVGVLHHMDDPIKGWKVLTDCLKSGGLMRIGLYSDLARQQIVKIREEIKKLNVGSDEVSMREFRTRVINSDQKNIKSIQSFTDFYSLSELRDLLFHVQEHRYTITKIKDCIAQLGLKFCGFETIEIVEKFKTVNTGFDDLYNLDKWNTYEEENSNTFGGMYQFWCQKL